MCSEPVSNGPLARLLRAHPVCVAEMDPRQVGALAARSPAAALFPEEAQSIARAVESRRQQFTAGRLLARQAWQKLGLAPQLLLSDEQRVPRWPAGIVGSITHTHGWCAAAVARAAQIVALGTDVEAATPLDTELWPRICRPEELRVLATYPAPRAGLLAKALFSAKESIYKALYPSVRIFLDFQAMHIELAPGADAGESEWQAELQVAWGPFEPGRRFTPGRLGIDHEWIVSGIALPSGALAGGRRPESFSGG
jgi:4'-phosphopantetheinyl transferase EntD